MKEKNEVIKKGASKKHVIGLLVRDHPGVMARITILISKRGFNIDTICVGKTEKEGISRIVLSVVGDDKTLEQVQKQLGKLIDVLKISDMKDDGAVIRELVLAKIFIKNADAKTEVLANAKIFRATIVDVAKNSVIVQMAGQPSKIEAFLELMKPFGIKEIARTGITAIARGTNFEAKQGEN